jgi:hypothetical protein
MAMIPTDRAIIDWSANAEAKIRKPESDRPSRLATLDV